MSSTPLIDQKKRDLEQHGEFNRKVALYRSLVSHLIGIIYIIAELHLGKKPDLRDRR